MRWFVLAAFAGFALSGCDQVSEIEAFAKCTERAESEIPAAKGLSGKNFSEDIEGLGNTDPNGNFKFAVPDANGSMLLTCSGNVKSRRIEEVSFNGVVRKPTSAEYWSY